MEPRQFSRGNSVVVPISYATLETFQWSHGNSAVGTGNIGFANVDEIRFQWSHGNSAVGTQSDYCNGLRVLHVSMEPRQFSRGNVFAN